MAIMQIQKAYRKKCKRMDCLKCIKKEMKKQKHCVQMETNMTKRKSTGKRKLR
jgi:hypothetical protein